MIEILPNTVSVYLPSSLKWDEIIAYAQNLVQKEKGIIWDFSFPITFRQPDQLVTKSWEFTLEYFKKTLFPLFEKETKGFILYKGATDFGYPKEWKPDDEENFHLFLEGKSESSLQKKLYCREQGFLQLKELSPFLPDAFPLYLFFDAFDLTLAQYCYDYFSIAVRGSSEGVSIWNWDGQTLQKTENVTKYGLVLPALSCIVDSDLEIMTKHLSKHPDCRLIPESLLTQEWQGLDTLFVLKDRLSYQGQRKLNGFLAAGGSVLNIDV